MSGIYDWMKTASAAITPIAPVIGLGSTIFDVIGKGLSEGSALDFEKKKFDWQKQQDVLNQKNIQRQMGMNTISTMKDDFKDALYRAFAR